MLFLTTVLSGGCGFIERESWVYLLSISIMTKPKKAPAKVLFTRLFLFKLLLNWGYVHLFTLLFPSFPVCYIHVAFVPVYCKDPCSHPQTVGKSLCAFIHPLPHQEPSIGFIRLVFCNFFMQEGCVNRSYGYVVRKSMTTPPKNPLVSLNHPAHL